MSDPNEQITPHRRTFIEYDRPRAEIVRPTWYLRRRASQITGPLNEQGQQNIDVTKAGGEAWILNPLKGDKTTALKTDFEAGYLDVDQVELAPGIQRFFEFRKPVELVDNGLASSVVSAGGPKFQKTWAPEQSIEELRLTADEEALPKPEQGSFGALDRVMASTVTFPANAGFMVRSTQGAFPDGRGELLTFYFGGQTGTDPEGSRGGEFACVVCGDGRLRLYEYNGEGWERRYESEGLGNAAPPNFLQLVALPYGRSQMHLALGGFDFAKVSLFSGVVPIMLDAKSLRTVYEEDPAKAKHTHRKTLTGLGQIRLDQRRDVRQAFQILRLLYPLSGQVVDKPFALPFPAMGENEVIRLVSVDWEGPAGTDVNVALYDATTHAPLTAGDSPGEFMLNSGQAHYYARIVLTSTDGESSPTFWGYQIEVPGRSTTPADTKTESSYLHQVHVTSPDITPDTETAQYSVKDVFAEHDILDQRGTVPVRITTAYSAEDPELRSVLFQGDTVDAWAVHNGVRDEIASCQWPGPLSKHYEVIAVGEWARIAEKRSPSSEFFGRDETAATDPKTGSKPPRKITDILRYVLRELAGYDESQIDIPDNSLRLWPTADANDYYLKLAAPLADFLIRLTRDYLGQILIFDANAGSNGMWRLIPNPSPPYTNLQEFVFDVPGTGPGLVHVPGRYGDGKTWIVHPSFRTKRVPPEGNYVLVIGAGGLRGGPDGKGKLFKAIVNTQSFSFPGHPPALDKTHIDYLPRFKPIIQPMPYLQTQEAVDFVARRIYDYACHGYIEVRWQSPLVLVTNPLDSLQMHPRPLRINDPVLVGGQQALIRSCNPRYDDDTKQMADYEAVLV